MDQVLEFVIGYAAYVWEIVFSASVAGLAYLAAAFAWDGIRAAWRAWLRYYRGWPS